MLIKVLLVLAFALAAYATLAGPAARQLATRRLLGLALAGGGMVAVVWPDLTTRAAHLVGVGRGTDLVLYLAVLAFVFVAIAVYQRIATLESAITQLSRELALRDELQDDRLS